MKFMKKSNNNIFDKVLLIINILLLKIFIYIIFLYESIEYLEYNLISFRKFKTLKRI